jgi:hypothetical protein
MATNITKCDRCGVEIAKDGSAIEQRKGDSFKTAGLPSKLDLCKECSKKYAEFTAGFLADTDDDDEA